jgi:glycosyltransferase involved in cell wall biosynthesis
VGEDEPAKPLRGRPWERLPSAERSPMTPGGGGQDGALPCCIWTAILSDGDRSVGLYLALFALGVLDDNYQNWEARNGAGSQSIHRLIPEEKKGKSMNICYVLNSSQIGGANRSMMCLWDGLRGSEIKPIVVCPGEGPMVEVLDNLQLDNTIKSVVQPSMANPFLTLRTIYENARYLRRKNISLVHATDVIATRAFLCSARLANIPVLCHVHFDLGRELYGWAFKHLPKPSGFLFCSEELMRVIGPRLEKSCEKAFRNVVHNAVDLDAFSVSRKSGSIPRIGIIANLQRTKGHELFLEMVQILKARGRLIAGEVIGGDLENSGRMQELKGYAERLGIADRVRFFGHILDVNTILRDLDVVVCASLVEPFGICLIEGMACGKPVVATRVGGIPEIVVHGKTGILVESGNSEALADAVCFLLDNPRAQRDFGREGRLRVEKLFSKEVFTAKIRRIYSDTLSLRKKGASLRFE